MVTTDEQTYERAAIEQWLARRVAQHLPCTSPLTGESLAGDTLVQLPARPAPPLQPSSVGQYIVHTAVGFGAVSEVLQLYHRPVQVPY